MVLQDTNALVFRALLAALGLSAEQDYDMNRCEQHTQHTAASLLLAPVLRLCMSTV
jgi:hypothetical protein